MMKSGMPAIWIWGIFPVYLVVVLFISWASKRRSPTSNQYLNASSSLPTWAVALSFLAYNCGSIEILGMSAMAAQYGVQALHFYWIGGIPGLVFMALVVLPLYLRTGARSLPEYFEMRFGPGVRLLSACLSALSTAAFSGVVLYGLAEVLHVFLGWSLLVGTMVSAGIVVAYVLVGGIRATVYTSVFQLCVLIGGLAPLLFLTVHFTPATFAARSARWRLWKPLPLLSPHAPLDRFGVALGLGFVISFAYWCTDFVMIQRALAANTHEGARKVPLLAGFGKAIIAFLIVLPGVAAPSILRGTGSLSFDEVLPRLLKTMYGPVLLAFGAAALLAGLMAGMAGNISGFSALWTEEIYRPRINPDQSERHYVRVGRISIVFCVLLALAGAYATFFFRDLMEFLQLILALFYAPVFAVVLAGATIKRLRSSGAIAAIMVGVLSGLAMQGSFWAGGVHFGSQMSANFYIALLEFGVALGICLISASFRGEESRSPNPLTVLTKDAISALRPSGSLILLSTLLLCLCALLNLLWW
jgi:solute:Na+ symporter, SSS family